MSSQRRSFGQSAVRQIAERPEPRRAASLGKCAYAFRAWDHGICTRAGSIRSSSIPSVIIFTSLTNPLMTRKANVGGSPEQCNDTGWSIWVSFFKAARLGLSSTLYECRLQSNCCSQPCARPYLGRCCDRGTESPFRRVDIAAIEQAFRLATLFIHRSKVSAPSHRDIGSLGDETGLIDSKEATVAVFNHYWSSVGGAGPSVVSAFSCALSRHQGRSFPQCAAHSWILAHRRRAVFPAPSRRRVWVFRPWQTSYPSERIRALTTSRAAGNQQT